MSQTMLYFTVGSILGTVITTICFLFIGPLVFKKKNYDDKKDCDDKRKGLYEQTFQTPQGDKIDVQYEIIEIERSDKKSKIKVVSLISNKNVYNKQGLEQNSLISMVNNSWVNSNNIEWIIKPIVDQRDDKINKILNN